MNRIEAFPLADGNYALIGNTYPIKDRIKQAGGRWDHDHGYWILSKETAKQFAPLLVWCQVDSKCHEGVRGEWVQETLAHPGKGVRTSCSMCDSVGIFGEVVSVDRSFVLR